MTALDHGRQDVGSRLDVDGSLDGSFDERAILQEEIERLRQRVEDLELTVVEYRSQMSQMLGSASWRVTSPLRASASRYRSAKARARRAAHRVRNGDLGADKLYTVGLLSLPDASLPEASPLRRRLDVNALHRPESSEGPVRRPDGAPAVLVVAHVHYPELWGDIEDRLARMPEAFDLLVSVTEGTAELGIPRILSRYPSARIEVVKNRGRDWGPLIQLVNKGLLSGYDAIAKVHTKKSEHRIDGNGWRIQLLDGVFESPEAIERTIALLREDRNVGIVVPSGQISGPEHWGSDEGIVESLAARLSLAFDPDRLQFPAGSMFWCRPWLLERFADLDLSMDLFEPEGGQYDATTAHGLERLVGVYAEVAGLDIVEAMDVRSRLASYRKNPRPRPSVYAFYLPQYHPTPENDAFWGQGFTDWVNVSRARPQFSGHLQPVLPSKDVGFYDLRDPNVLRQQARTAREHGVDGLVFHHYWFDGRKVLDTPLNNWLADPDIDLPLALCWANEPWSRRWDGQESDVLIAQTYGEGWAERFWDDIEPAMRDQRYIRFDGAPLLVLYRPGLIPKLPEAIATWRRRAAEAGLPAIYVAGVRPSREVPELEPSVVHALDGLISFPPGGDIRTDSVIDLIPGECSIVEGDVMSYQSAFEAELPLGVGGKPVFPGVMPGWDNTARRGSNAYLFLGANPVSFAGVLRRRRPVAGPASDGGAVFVNAWNEWAEGAAIEPSARFGTSNLSSILDVYTARGVAR